MLPSQTVAADGALPSHKSSVKEMCILLATASARAVDHTTADASMARATAATDSNQASSIGAWQKTAPEQLQPLWAMNVIVDGQRSPADHRSKEQHQLQQPDHICSQLHDAVHQREEPGQQR